jgi:hypothetical protein
MQSKLVGAAMALTLLATACSNTDGPAGSTVTPSPYVVGAAPTPSTAPSSSPSASASAAAALAAGAWVFQATNLSDNRDTILMVDAPAVKVGWYVDYVYNCRPRENKLAPTFWLDYRPIGVTPFRQHRLYFVDNSVRQNPDQAQGRLFDRASTANGPIQFLVGGPCTVTLTLSADSLVQPYRGAPPQAIGYKPGQQMLTRQGGGGNTQVSFNAANSAWRLDWKYQCTSLGHFEIQLNTLALKVNEEKTANQGSFTGTMGENTLYLYSSTNCAWSLTITAI